MQWYEDEVRALVKTLASQPVIPDPAVFYGSSSIRLWTRLAEDLRDPRAINAAFGGSTLEACAYFFDRIVPPLHPVSLVLYAGDNDLGDGRSPEQLLGYFKAIAEKVAKLPGSIPFGFMAVKPSPARAGILDRIRRTNELIAQELPLHPNAFLIDLVPSMLSPQGKPRPELFLADGLHMNAAGYKLWTELLEPYRNRIFNSRFSSCNSQAVSSDHDLARSAQAAVEDASGVSQMVQSPSQA